MSVISRKLFKKMRDATDYQLAMKWYVFDAEGNLDPKNRLFKGAYVYVEDMYDRVILRCNEDHTLVECTVEGD